MRITQAEQKVLVRIQQHIYLIIVILITIGSMIIRFSMRDIVSADAKTFLLPWYDEIYSGGGCTHLANR